MLYKSRDKTLKFVPVLATCLLFFPLFNGYPIFVISICVYSLSCYREVFVLFLDYG